MKQFLMELPVGLIAHGKIQPGLFVHNAFGVGESEKTGFSVVGSHAAVTETAKSHFAGGQMDDGIVDAAYTLLIVEFLDKMSKTYYS